MLQKNLCTSQIKVTYRSSGEPNLRISPMIAIPKFKSNSILRPNEMK